MNDNNKKVISIRKEILNSKFIIKDQKLNDIKKVIHQFKIRLSKDFINY